MPIETKYEIALCMLAEWVNAVKHNGTQWDDWDDYYKDASFRDTPIRADLDEAIRLTKKYFVNEDDSGV